MKKYLKVPDHLSYVPKNIRENAKAHGVSVHDDWTDADLLNLWEQCFHDDDLIEASLDMDPEEALNHTLFDK